MKTYHIITIGCQMNYADSERLASRLEQNGYKKTADKHGADLVIVNTCGVRQTAENRIYGLIPRIKKENLKVKIVLTGCLAERKDVKRRLKDYVDLWLPIGGIMNHELRIMDKMPRRSVQRKDDYLEVKPKYESKFSVFLPIGNGCDNFCSYCVVPYARGREVYRSAKKILNEVRGLIKRGYKEIILIAQNVNSYKSQNAQGITHNKKSPPPPSRPNDWRRPVGIDFAGLLMAVNKIKGDFWIRFLTSHPKDMSQKLIETISSCEKVCQQIYLPVQAGDDEVLENMNRKYTRADYIKLVGIIREVLNDQISSASWRTNNQKSSKFQIPNYKTKPEINFWQPPVAITTDLIVGFPGETKKQFNNSVKLFKQIKFDMAYISEYSPRPGTAAFKLFNNVSPEEKANRKNRLDKILRQTALANNKKYIGKVARVLIESKTKTGEWFGRTATGKDVRFSAERLTSQVGNFVDVKITGAKEFCLAGVMINKS